MTRVLPLTLVSAFVLCTSAVTGQDPDAKQVEQERKAAELEVPKLANPHGSHSAQLKPNGACVVVETAVALVYFPAVVYQVVLVCRVTSTHLEGGVLLWLFL